MSKRRSLPLAHRVYRRVRPFLYRLGVLYLARRFISRDKRDAIASQMGLAGFDTRTTSGALPRWANRRPYLTPDDAQGVTYIGDLRAEIGISEHSRLMVQTFAEAGVRTRYHEIAYRFHTRTAQVPNFEQDERDYPITIIDQNISHFYDAVMSLPHHFLAHRYRIALWAWELEQVPREWVKYFGMLHEVWVSSRFIQEALARVSPIPIVRMPFAVEPPPVRPQRARFRIPDDAFVFLFAFSATSTAARKNPFAVIEAFEKAFGCSRAGGPVLVMKAHHLQMPESRLLADRLRAAMRRIGGYLIEEHYDRQTTFDLLASCDAFVSLHRSEGFGLLLAEAMALGKPVIATGYSGNTDFMTPSNSLAVRYVLRDILESDHRDQPELAVIYPPGGFWAEPDTLHAAHWMNYLVDNPTTAAEIGASAAAHMRTFHSRHAVGLRLRERLAFIADVQGQQKRWFAFVP